MRGRRQALQPNEPPYWFNVAHQPPIDPQWWTRPADDLAPRPEVVEYVKKPNRFDDTTKWAYALTGSKVGDIVQCLIPCSPIVFDGVAGADDFIKRNVSEVLHLRCAEHGLKPVHAHEVWRGNRVDALALQNSYRWLSLDEATRHAVSQASEALWSLGAAAHDFVAVVFSAVADLPDSDRSYEKP